MNRELIIQALDFNLSYAKELLRDIPDERLAERPARGLENHAAFTLGHLCMASARMVKALGGEMKVPKGYVETFDRNGPGDPRLPSIDRSVFPSKKDLLDQLEHQHEEVKRLLLRTDHEKLQKKNKVEVCRSFRKYVRDAALYGDTS